ncbi:hypothetical protein [Serratia marcescens]|uniref:hypothetical protein n=1 Tax=Serratia marcescens TaxID=615 RepID=UPI00235F6FEB|nr:hypothetical protein [Serratia marcescens]
MPQAINLTPCLPMPCHFLARRAVLFHGILRLSSHFCVICNPFPQRSQLFFLAMRLLFRRHIFTMKKHLTRHVSAATAANTLIYINPNTNRRAAQPTARRASRGILGGTAAEFFNKKHTGEKAAN